MKMMRAQASMILMVSALVAIVPAAQAYSSVPAAGCAMPMMQMQQAAHACCAQACECTIEQSGKDILTLAPAAAHQIVLMSSGLIEAIPGEIATAEDEKAAPRADRSPPPQDPLYQTYSEYRL